ncbi:MAG: ABC transporter permease [Ruminococcaceae bacterium]|nr:ABC transporter permease [Oscillospiraceae bacterium]
MARYIFRRFLISIVVIFVVLFLSYALIYNLPENYAEIAAREMCLLSGGQRSASEWEQILMSEYGLDKGLVKGFLSWISDMICGNFGKSWYYGVAVTEKFSGAFVNSVSIGFIAAVASMLISVPAGIYTASGKKSLVSVLISVLSVLLISMPVFFVIALLKYVFAIKLGLFDLGGLRSFDSIGDFGFAAFCDRISHMILPVIAIIISSSGTLIRYVHINIQNLLGSRYIKALRAKGISDGDIVSKHLVRNVMVPVINLFFAVLPTVFAGSIAVETLFSIDGIGHLAYIALINGDVPLIMFYIMYTTIMTVGFAFIADIMCAAVDYRVANTFERRV